MVSHLTSHQADDSDSSLQPGQPNRMIPIAASIEVLVCIPMKHGKV